MNDREYYEKFGELPGDKHGDEYTMLSHHQLIMLARHNEKQVTDLTAEVSKVSARRTTLERENDYLMATLADIRAGLDALHYHIVTASSSDDGPEGWTEFMAAFAAIKLTHSALRNAINEWESKFVDDLGEIPF